MEVSGSTGEQQQSVPHATSYFFCFSFIAIRMNLELLLAMSGG